MAGMDTTKNTLLCPFLDDDPRFAFGVEFGLLWARMKDGEPIAGYFTVANQDQILLAASRLGWTANMPDPPGEPGPWLEDWFWLELEPPVCGVS